MTSLEQTSLREISTLPEAHQADGLTFVRFLKVSLPDNLPKNIKLPGPNYTHEYPGCACARQKDGQV